MGPAVWPQLQVARSWALPSADASLCALARPDLTSALPPRAPALPRPPSVLSSGSRGWHCAAARRRPSSLAPASISHHHHHAQMLTLQPHAPDRPQRPATSPRIIYADAALTRCGPARQSMSSATAAQRAHAALQAPGGHGMAAANRPAFSAACAGEKIPENPGCLPTNLDPRNKQSTSHNISRNQELVVSRADEGHFPWFQHGRNHGKDHRQE